MKMILTFGLAASLLCAQPQPEIHGTVIEQGSNHGIEGVQVTLTKTITPERSGPFEKTISKTTTDALGAFSFQALELGAYAVSVQKDGYSSVGNTLLTSQPRAQAKLDISHPVGSVQLTLARAAELTGRVVDADTGKPLTRFSLAIMQTSYTRGKRSVLTGRRVVTGEDGRFDLTGVSPGSYLAVVAPEAIKDPVQTAFSDADASRIDLSYEASYWPGGGPLDLASPLVVNSLGHGDFGTISPRKTQFYRLRGRISGADCSEGAKVGVTFHLAESRVFSSLNVPCGPEFLIRNLQAGLYDLTLLSGEGESRVSLNTQVAIVDRNVDVTFALTHGADVDGRLVAAQESSQPSFPDLTVRVMFPSGGVPAMQDMYPTPPDSEGRFKLVDAQWVPVKVTVSGLSGTFYVQEIRYNGAAVRDDTIPLDSGAGAQNVEILIDDKPAAIAGKVTENDQPVSNAYLVLEPWPPAPDPFDTVITAHGGVDGTFQFPMVRPGEYKIAAIAESAKDKLDEPHVLEQLLSGAERFTVERGSVENLELKLARLF